MDENICQTCLSVNRRMIPILKVLPIIQQCLINEIKHLKGYVCWECCKIMDKFSKFKFQVKLAQDSLKSKKIRIRKSFSNLYVHTKSSYDYQFYYNFDPLTSSEENNKEINVIKEEDLEIDNCNYDDENIVNDKNSDEKPDIDNCVNVYVDLLEVKPNVINTYNDLSRRDDIMRKISETLDKNSKVKTPNETVKKEKANYKRRKQVQENNKNIKNKFTKIVFTVEEMLHQRELRRNRPNFKKIPYKCDSCLIGFTKQEKIKEHMEIKHNERIGALVCDICKVRFRHKNALERHCQTHFVFYTCKLCKFKSVEMWNAYNHCETKHSNDDLNSIHCQQCTEVVKSPDELEEHMKAYHAVYCNECGEKFLNRATLRTHKVRIHGVKREFVCTICNKSFMKESRLETHVANHNDTLAQQLSYCTICKIQYKSVQVYRSHLKHSAAHSSDLHPCSVCNKKFSSKVYLTKHFNFYHLKKSQFKCDLCNKLFISDWRLKNHKQLYHGMTRTRNHACNVCGKKFFTLATLRGHQLTHSADRSFMCEDCGDTFKQRPALYTHTRLVHKGGKRGKTLDK